MGPLDGSAQLRVNPHGQIEPLPMKQRLKNGHVPVGTMVFEFFVPGMAQMARAVGADFLMYDTEHSGADIEAIKAQCAACNGTGVVPLVRVPGFHYHFVARAMDAGAHGIMMPMVADAEQARALVIAMIETPEGVAAVDRIVAAAQRHGKTAAVMAGDEAWARRYHGLGFRMFAYGLDAQLFQRALAAGIGAVRALE